MAFLPRRLAGYGEASSWEVVVQPIDVDDRAAVQPKAPRGGQASGPTRGSTRPRLDLVAPVRDDQILLQGVDRARWNMSGEALRDAAKTPPSRQARPDEQPRNE